MKHLWKKITAGAAALVLAVAVVAVPASAAVTLPTLPADQCVVDDAGVLSDSVTSYMNELNGKLEANCSGAQIGVLTVQYTGSASTEEYALEAFNAWGIGSSENNNGVLILLVMESPLYADGDYYLTYGDGFRNTTIDRQASTLSQTMEDDFVAKDYDAAVETCAAAVADTIAQIYGVDFNSGETVSSSGGFNIGAMIIALALLVVMVILVFGPLLNSFFPFCFGFGLGSAFRGPRYHYHNHYYHHAPPPPPPRGPRGPRPPRGGGFGGGFGGGGFGGGGFGGMGGGSSHGGGGGRGR